MAPSSYPSSQSSPSASAASSSASAYPEAGEYVLGNIKKIVPYGAFVELDEYRSQDAFLHISEISSGWIRNIREHIKEGQKVVVLVVRVDKEKRQIDVSLKKVSEADRKRKLESRQLEKRSEKLLERAGLKIHKTLLMAQREIAPILVAEYGDLYSAFESFSKGEAPSPKIPAAWAAALADVAKVEIKEKEVTVRASLMLESFAGNGIEQIHSLLASIAALSAGKTKVSLLYLGAPNYYVDVISTDLKSAEGALNKARAILEKSSGKDLEFSLEKIKS